MLYNVLIHKKNNVNEQKISIIDLPWTYSIHDYPNALFHSKAENENVSNL